MSEEADEDSDGGDTEDTKEEDRERFEVDGVEKASLGEVDLAELLLGLELDGAKVDLAQVVHKSCALV